ncbi:methyltransferase [Catenovulum agarivorans]|uniref:methyltransferase n=1 Tax=Catenovulum agarivorans TaxID=1172192 RepID=UPI00030F8F45|nr:methyltransferase [Catenovulum agarivorans]
MNNLETSTSLSVHFEKLDAALTQYQAYWNFVPFQCSDFPWDNPELTEYLQTLAEQTELEHDEVCQQIAQRFFPELADALEQVDFVHNQLVDDWQKPVPFWLLNGIHGRKITQVQQLSAQIKPKYPLLEWCAGKGHLGRLLSFQHDVAVTSVEWQQGLCEQGTNLAKTYDIKQDFIHADVLKQRAVWLKPQQHVVALHACGDLHVTLLKQAVEAQVEYMHVAPCCYHLIGDEVYPALSQQGKQSSLHIAKSILKLAVQAQVTAGQRVANLRQTEVLWRLAYQLIRADITGDASYQSLPSVKKSWFTGEFVDFVTWGAEHQGFTLPADLDFADYLQRAAIKQKFTQQLEYVRHAFQRALELWLVLDKALFLEQSGYQVEVNYFCPYQTTPRNMMIVAKL